MLLDKFFLHEGHIASRRSISLVTPGGSSFGYENMTGVKDFKLTKVNLASLRFMEVEHTKSHECPFLLYTW